MMSLVLFLVPAFTASSVAGERTRQTLIPVQMTSLGPFDIVYADPPFRLEPAPILEGLALAVGDVLFLEADRSTRVPESLAGLRHRRTRTFGGVTVHTYERTT